MNKLYSSQKISEIADKGQKIVAALYLVTDHLSDNEPLKYSIRERALVLHELSGALTDTVHVLVRLLKSASIARLISDQNVSILVRELQAFCVSAPEQHTIDTLFAPRLEAVSRTNGDVYKSNDTQPRPIDPVKSDSKNKRQDQILSFINGRKSAVIKDISGLFPEVSEKTIQRELGALVDAGKITKRGSKRWSIYMAIQ